MNNADDIRKGFEAEFKQIISGSESLLVRFPYRDRRYVDWNTEHCWLMWKAAIESQATRIAELEAAITWISVKDALPPEGIYVFFYSSTYHTDPGISYHTGTQWESEDGMPEEQEVEYWAYINYPTPPAIALSKDQKNE